MAQIRSVGPGVRSKGKVDGLVYVHINGKTYARSLPIMPAGMYKTPEARKRQALFRLSQLYIKHHAGTIIKSFDKFGSRSSRTAFCKANGKALNKAFEQLALRLMTGEVITPAMLDTAAADYATANPDAIVIGKKVGYQPVYLTGPWPSTITMLPDSGDSSCTVIIHTPGAIVPPTPGGDSTTEQVTVSVLASPSNGGTVAGGGTVAKGSQVTLQATANSGYSFSRWSDGNTSAQRTVTASSSMTYAAQFTANAPSGGGNGDD